MLIFSPPGGGKTSLIRDLAARIGGGARHGGCAIVDERREFVREDYSGLAVDILRGYKKLEGIEIAKRALCPQVIIIDELSGAEAAALSSAVSMGVRLIATLHANSREELYRRAAVAGLIRSADFRMGVRLGRSGVEFECEITDLEDKDEAECRTHPCRGADFGEMTGGVYVI